jgi:hypothetical protein
MQAVSMDSEGLSVAQRLEAFPWMISELTLPFMMEYLVSPDRPL